MNTHARIHSFTDSAGREWKLQIDPAAQRRVQAATGVPLDKLFGRNGHWLMRMDGEPMLVAAVVWAIVQPDAKGLCGDQFLGALTGDQLGQAHEALVRAAADAIRHRGRRAAAHTLLNQRSQVRERFFNEAAAAIKRADIPEITKQFAAKQRADRLRRLRRASAKHVID